MQRPGIAGVADGSCIRGAFKLGCQTEPDEVVQRDPATEGTEYPEFPSESIVNDGWSLKP